MKTIPLFMYEPEIWATKVNILEIGENGNGSYFLPDQTIYYPTGGGQLQDIGFITHHGKQIDILSAKYDNGYIKHFTKEPVPENWKKSSIGLKIFQNRRRRHSALHTAGHWITQVITENLGFDLYPIRATHYPSNSFIELDGELPISYEELISQVHLAMRIDLQANLNVNSVIDIEGSETFKKSFKPKNFKVPTNKPLRFVTIDSYKPVPCGGTHVKSIREVRSTAITGIEKTYSGLRLSYTCKPRLMSPPS